MMNGRELGAFMREHFTRSAFRLETLQTYEVASDGSDFARYLAGEPSPSPERKEPFLARLREESARGLYRHRVRVVTYPVSDYTKFEAEWGYLPNSQAGEDIRILDLSERTLPVDVIGDDFWLVDNKHAVCMHYGMSGELLGATVEPDAVRVCREVRDVMWAAAEPFADWWGRHQELHRDRRQVA